MSTGANARLPVTLDFGIYVAFFPQLVAGPIERAKQLLPQISTLSERSTIALAGV